MKRKRSFFLLAGEPSGDIHGQRMIASLKKIDPESRFFGVGGPLMEGEGLKSVFPMEELAVMGFQEIVAKIPSLLKKLLTLKNCILENRPDAVVLIDFPDFNLFLARILRWGGYQGKIVQMIPPTVWAWRKKRIRTLERYFDLVLLIYPFEKKLYEKTALAFAYIGNPVMEAIQKHEPDPQFRKRFGFDESDRIIALFPGSRRSEIENNLSLHLEAVRLIEEEIKPCKIALSLARDELKENVLSLVKTFGIANKVTLIPSLYRYDLMQNCSLAVAKSGTVTLELALQKKPAVVTYAVSPLNYFIAKYVVRLNLPHYSIANILAGEEIFPEHIADRAPSRAVAESIKSVLNDEKKRIGMLEKENRLYQSLGTLKPQEEIEKAIRSLLQ